MGRKVLIPLLHFVLIFLAYLSPFVFDIKLMMLGLFLYLLQQAIFGACILNILQFGDKTSSLYCYYLTKLGYKPNKKLIVFVQGVIMPLVILLVAIVYQILLKRTVLIHV